MFTICNENYQAYRTIIGKIKVDDIKCLSCNSPIYDYKKITVQKQSGRTVLHDNRICYDCNVQNNYND